MKNNDPYELRRCLTFEQAEGVEPIPTQLQTKQLSKKLRARLWQVVYSSMEKDEQWEDQWNPTPHVFSIAAGDVSFSQNISIEIT